MLQQNRVYSDTTSNNIEYTSNAEKINVQDTCEDQSPAKIILNKFGRDNCNKFIELKDKQNKHFKKGQIVRTTILLKKILISQIMNSRMRRSSVNQAVLSNNLRNNQTLLIHSSGI